MSARGALALALVWALAAGGCKVVGGDPGQVAPVALHRTLQPPDPGWEPAVRLNGWTCIVVHHSGTAGGSAALFEKYHRTVRHFENGMGYHFVIGNGVDVADGLVEVGERWTRQLQGAHVGGELNKEAIGVCLVGDFSQTHPTAKQLAALDRLLRFLQARCRIPTSKILGHAEVRPGHTICPGPNFSMGALRESLRADARGGESLAAPYDPPQAATLRPQGLRLYGPVRSIK